MNPKTQNPISRNAKHTLTEDEIKQYNESLLAALQSKKEIEAEKKEVASAYKNKIAEQELAIDKISNLMRVGYEIRPFQCYLVKNFDDGKREYYEFGSDKLVDVEPLNAADYQTEMQMAEAQIKANNEAADNTEGVSEQLEVAGFTIVPVSEISHRQDDDMEATSFDAVDEIQEPTPTKIPEAIVKPLKTKGAANASTIIIEPTNELEADPFGTDDEDEDPFSFDDI